MCKLEISSYFLNRIIICVRRFCLISPFTLSDLGSGGFVPSQSITVALRDLYSMMDRGASFSPVVLLQVLRLAFPRFAEKGAGGHFMQQVCSVSFAPLECSQGSLSYIYRLQDANECWTELVRMLQQKLPAKPVEGVSNQPKYVLVAHIQNR